MSENIFFVSFVLGAMIGISLMTKLFKRNKSSFFLGLIVFILAFELLFSWGAISGYNNEPHAFPIPILLNYLIIPPSLWLFIKYNTNSSFRFHPKHLLLFVPAILESILQFSALHGALSLREYRLWVWFSEYLPMAGFVFVIIHFWIVYTKTNGEIKLSLRDKTFTSQIKLLALMSSLTLLCLLWLIFTFTGWQYFNIIEYSLIFMFFGLAFVNFLESQPFSAWTNKPTEFPQYDDKEHLIILNQILQEKQIFLKPNLSLKELAAELNLPARYVSYLINHYHKKNYKEFINQYRIDTFLVKAKSEEKNYKTLLALALESGFSSKSTFNQVFKKQMGKTPSEYLK